MSKCLCGMGFANADWPVENHRLAGVQPRRAARSRSMAAGSLGLTVKSKSSKVLCCLESWARRSPWGQGSGLAAGDFVFAEHCQEFQVSQFASQGFGQIRHRGCQTCSRYRVSDAARRLGSMDGHDEVPFVARSLSGATTGCLFATEGSGPRSITGLSGHVDGLDRRRVRCRGRIPLTVRYPGSPTAMAPDMQHPGGHRRRFRVAG